MITDKEIYQTADDEKQQDWNDKAYEAIYKDGFIDGAKWARAKQVSVKPVVMLNFADLADEVKQDIENRIIKGVQTYGERLRINNGRNALLDAYEEILDLALYIKQELKEKESKISA